MRTYRRPVAGGGVLTVVFFVVLCLHCSGMHICLIIYRGVAGVDSLSRCAVVCSGSGQAGMQGGRGLWGVWLVLLCVCACVQSGCTNPVSTLVRLCECVRVFRDVDWGRQQPVNSACVCLGLNCCAACLELLIASDGGCGGYHLCVCMCAACKQSSLRGLVCGCRGEGGRTVGRAVCVGGGGGWCASACTGGSRFSCVGSPIYPSLSVCVWGCAVLLGLFTNTFHTCWGTREEATCCGSRSWMCAEEEARACNNQLQADRRVSHTCWVVVCAADRTQQGPYGLWLWQSQRCMAWRFLLWFLHIHSTGSQTGRQSSDLVQAVVLLHSVTGRVGTGGGRLWWVVQTQLG